MPLAHRPVLLIAAASLLGVALASAAHLEGRAAVRAALLRADPDAIPAQSALNAYAVAAGSAAYADHCAGCHGKGLEGDPRRAVAPLRGSRWLYGSGRIGELERTILYGVRSGHPKAWNLASMPAFGTPTPYKAYKIAPLTPGDIRDITAYVYALRHAGGDPGAIARGGRVFHTTGLCFDCHGADARGDPAIGAPDLTDASWLAGDGSPASIAQTITFGMAGACPPWIARLPAATIRSIAVFIHAANSGA
jgi:cytochrome c oxidase cbb3-type subunit 3